jgi:hypothetical protein
LLPWENFTSGGAESVIPRRFFITSPTEDSKNYENELKAYQDQGFTTGTNDPNVLNSQKLWFDKTNPAYGAGPIQ